MVRHAKTLNSKFIHVMSGVADGSAVHASLVANLRWAATHAPERQLTIEPLNTEDMPEFFIQLDAEGYAGYVSGEYRPKGRIEDGLDWLR